MLFTTKALRESDEDVVDLDMDILDGEGVGGVADEDEGMIDGDSFYDSDTTRGDDDIASAQAAQFESVTEPVEMGYRIIAEMEYNYNQLCEAVGLYELNEVARGRRPILEKADFKAWFEKIKTMLKRMVEKVAMMCKKAVATIVTNTKTIDRFIRSNKDAITAGYTAIAATTGDDAKKYTIKAYRFTNWKNAEDGIRDAISKADDDQNKGLTELISGFTSGSFYDRNVALNTGSATEDDKVENINDSTFDRIRGKFVGETTCSSSDFKKKLKTKLCGSEKPVEVKINDLEGNIDFVMRCILDKSAYNSINNVYKTFERTVNDTLKKLNMIKKKMEKDDTNLSVANGYIQKVKGFKAVCINAISVYLGCYMTKFKQDAKVLRMCATKGRQIRPKAESYYDSDSDLFNFDLL